MQNLGGSILDFNVQKDLCLLVILGKKKIIMLLLLLLLFERIWERRWIKIVSCSLHRIGFKIMTLSFIVLSIPIFWRWLSHASPPSTSIFFIKRKKKKKNTRRRIKKGKPWIRTLIIHQTTNPLDYWVSKTLKVPRERTNNLGLTFKNLIHHDLSFKSFKAFDKAKYYCIFIILSHRKHENLIWRNTHYSKIWTRKIFFFNFHAFLFLFLFLLFGTK